MASSFLSASAQPNNIVLSLPFGEAVVNTAAQSRIRRRTARSTVTNLRRFDTNCTRDRLDCDVYGQSEAVERAMQAGFDAHVLKPADFELLAALLNKLGHASQVVNGDDGRKIGDDELIDARASIDSDGIP
jgi:hypothetical protein